MKRLGLSLAGLAFCSACSTISGWWPSSSREFRPADPVDLQARIEIDGQSGNNQVDHFAVLIGANTELRHRGNLSLAYQVLLEQGYRAENVYVLDSEGTSPFFPLTDLTSRDSVTLLFNHLAEIVEPHDTLFVYVTGHGRRIKADSVENGESKTLGVSTLVLNPGEELSQDEFVALLELVKPHVGIAFFDQCYWGQFDRDRMCNFVTITTSSEDETSHGVSFPRAFWAAFRDREASAKGPITILDAFKEAMVSDRATRLGLNRPRITHACVHPGDIVLLGEYKEDAQLATHSPVVVR